MDDSCKIQNRVISTASPNPSVEHLALGFALGRLERLEPKHRDHRPEWHGAVRSRSRGHRDGYSAGLKQCGGTRGHVYGGDCHRDADLPVRNSCQLPATSCRFSKPKTLNAALCRALSSLAMVADRRRRGILPAVRAKNISYRCYIAVTDR